MANTFKFGNGNWAVKDGYALAYNDENNNFKPLPFDFTRASSATTLNRQGLIETVPSGKPRIDFLNNTNGHLLLEPSRTNLAQRSEEFDNVYWQKVRATITANQIVSPDGSVTADLLTATDTSENYCQQNVSSTVSGSQQTASFFVKKGTSDFCHILLWDVSNDGARQWFDLTNGSVGTSTTFGSGVTVDSAKMINYGNGWYRCIVVFNNSNTTVRTRISASNSNGSTLSTSGKTIYIWGAQLEVGSYATSYIPTEGSSVTRVVELMTQTPPSDIIGQTEGTLYIDFTPNTDEATTKWLAFLGSGSQYIGIYILSNAKIRLEVANTTSQALFDTSFTITKGQRYKCAIAYANNDFTAYVNGTQLGTDTNGSVPATSTIRNYYNTSSIEGTNTNDLKIYDTRLTNTELQNLTS